MRISCMPRARECLIDVELASALRALGNRHGTRTCQEASWGSAVTLWRAWRSSTSREPRQQVSHTPALSSAIRTSPLRATLVPFGLTPAPLDD